MSAHYRLVEEGVIEVTYDDPSEAPNYGECGEAIEYNGDEVALVEMLPSPVNRERWLADIPQHLAELHRRAKLALPLGTVYEIRGRIPSAYGRKLGLAWYHVHAMKDWPVTGSIEWPGKLNQLGGYIQLGTFKT